MSFDSMVTEAKKTFPKLTIAYKDQSTLMKIIGTLLFFVPEFMTKYTTTIYPTIYFPSQSFVDNSPLDSQVLLAHELLHCDDAKNINPIIFGILYLFPTILFTIIPFLLFILSWKIVLPLFILSLCPIPSYFRKVFEMRAYMVSIYANRALCIKINWAPDYPSQEANIVSQFKTSAYYYMWPFNSVNRNFDNAVSLVKSGNRPFSQLPTTKVVGL